MTASITANHSTTPTKEGDWFVYLVQNRLDQFYCGVTNNPSRRIRQHRGELVGGAKALKGKAPLRFVFVYQVNSKSVAMQAEYWLKQQPRRIKEQVRTSQHELFEETFTGKNVTANYA